MSFNGFIALNTFLVGLLAFFQMTFIPGFILLKYVGWEVEGRLRKLVYVFSLSLLVNYLLVFFLTVLGGYTCLSVYLVIAVEVVLLVLYYWKREKGVRVIHLDWGATFRSFRELTGAQTLFFNVCLVLGLVVLGLFFYFFLSRVKAVFFHNDAVLGWNRFALDWFHNQLPVNTWLYPQMIPANWSLSYVMMQTPDIQFIARNIMPFFSMGTGLLFLDLGLRKKNGVYFLGLVFYGYIIMYLYSPGHITCGYMDIAVAFFCFLAFYELHRERGVGAEPGQDNKKKYREIIQRAVLSVIFACAAAVTKQAGLYMLVVVLVWNGYILAKHGRELGLKRILKTVGVSLLLIIVIVVSWYGLRLILINQGVETSGVQAVTQEVHKNRSYGERWEFGFKQILQAEGKQNDLAQFLVHLSLLFMIMGLVPKTSRYVMVGIVVPFTLMWGFWFSYDYRNLTAAFPFMAFSMAFGAHWIVKGFLGLVKKVKAPGLRVWQIWAGVAVVAILLNFTLFKSSAIRDNQVNQQRRLGDYGLNLKLYNYFKEKGLQGKVFSKYPYFRYLPILRDYHAEERDEKGVRYLIEDFTRPNRQILKEIKKKIKSGEYRVVFTYGQYRFIEIQ